MSGQTSKSGASSPSATVPADSPASSDPATTSAGSNTVNVRYVAGDGIDTNDGLSVGSAKADVWSALFDLINTDNIQPGGTIYVTQNNTDAGRIWATDPNAATGHGTLLPQNGYLAGGIWIMGPSDPNYVKTTGVIRSGGTVTVAASAAVPSSAYYQTGRTITVSACADASYDGNFVIATVIGSSIAYSQSGADSSSSGCVITPIGWLPQINSSGLNFTCAGGGDSGAGPGGAGPSCGMTAGQWANTGTITSISESGNTVTATVTGNSNFYPGIPVEIAGVGTTGYNGYFIVASVTSNTFTYTNPASGLATDTNGGTFAMVIPSLWLSGVSNITTENLAFSGPMPAVFGVDSNFTLNKAINGSSYQFNNTSFSAVPGNGGPLVGPATWIGSNLLWVYFNNCSWSANPSAPETSDNRAAVLMKSLPGGATSGLIYITNGNSTGGGGVRWYEQSGSSSIYINGFLEEGTGQSQPVFEVMSQAGELSALVENASISDSGDKPPVVEVPAGWAAGASSVTAIDVVASGSGIATQGPMTVINDSPTNVTSVSATTGSTSSPQAQGEIGFGAGGTYNLQTDAARLNFSPAAVPFQNMASQLPSQWTVAEGTGVTVANSLAPNGTQNAGLVTCTANGPDGVCGVYVYSATQTFSAGDYVVMEVWVQPADHSAGPYIGFQGTISVSGPTLSQTDYFGTNANACNRANANPQADGSWQRVYLWAKVATGGTVSTKMRLDFSPTQPTIFYAPAIYFFSGQQLPSPPAPVILQSQGSTLAATTYFARTSYVGGAGETLASAESSLPATAGSLITVPSPAAIAGATGWNVYVGNTASCPGVGSGALSGPGETCEVKQNSGPLPIGVSWNEPTSGLVAFGSWYSGANGPAGETQPNEDTTNAYGDSEIADWALNTQSVPSNITAGPTVATMQGLNFAFGGSGDNYFAILDHTNFTANRTFEFPNASGTVALTNIQQNWTAPQTFDTVNLDSETIGGQTLNSVPIALYSVFLPGPLTTSYTAAQFTPAYGIVVTRIEITLKTGPQTCAANAVVQLSGRNTWDMVLASPVSDSGPITVSMNGGTPIQVLLETAAQGCAVAPQDANIQVQYQMQ